MTDPAGPVIVTLRIPGTWANPNELAQRLPEGHRLTPDTLVLPDGTEIEFGARKADGQFAQVFRSSCRQPPADDELAAVDSYRVNSLLSASRASPTNRCKRFLAD